MRRLFSLSHIAAGFIAILVGYTSSAAIVFQAATAAGGGPEHISSWLWALGIGMFATSTGLSLYFRAPVLTAWSTPGAALLATSLAGVPMSEAIGAFLFASALIVVCGVFGLFEAIMRHVPKALAAALLAGVLTRFGLDLFVSLRTQWPLVLLMLAVYLGGRRFLPRYAVPLAFLAGLLAAAFGGLIRSEAIELQLTMPLWTTPSFSLATLIGVGLPLFIVTMASQNVPGLAVLRANGYETPASPIITVDRHHRSAAGTFRGLCLQPGGDHCRHLHESGCRSRSAPALPGSRVGRLLLPAHRSARRHRRQPVCRPAA
jgi:benzoate membrane transport protein